MTAMDITHVAETTDLLQVLATIEGERFEFTAYRGGDVEVYSFPKAWKGVPRFVGRLPPAITGHLFAVLQRQGRLKYAEGASGMCSGPCGKVGSA